MSDFENDLKNMFEKAEFSPSERVWTGVQSAIKPKKKGIFFYWQTYGIAAAIALIVTFSLLFSNGGWNDSSSSSKKLSEIQKQDSTQNNNGTTKSANTTATKPNEAGETNASDTGTSTQNAAAKKIDNSRPLSSLEMDKMRASKEPQKENNLISTKEPDEKDSRVMAFSEGDLSASNKNDVQLGFLQLPGLPENINVVRAKWELKHMVASMDISDMILEEESQSDRAILVSGGLSSGSFSPNPSNSADMALNADFGQNSVTRSVTNGEERQEGSIAVGGGIGFDLSERWSLNAGLRYSEYKFASQANAYSVEDRKSLPIYIPAGYSGEVFFVGNYNVTNTIRSISVPLTANFKVVDFGKFDVGVKAGVALDYFLSYEVKGDLNFLETRKTDLSGNGLYSRWNKGVISGLSLNYRFNQQWGVSGEAFFRKYLSPTNQDGYQRSSPSILGFGLNLNYFIRKDED